MGLWLSCPPIHWMPACAHPLPPIPMSRSCPPAAPQRLRPSFARRFAVPFAAVLVVGGLALPWAAHAQEATGPGQEAVS
ncbi:MAG TPA: carbohydrate porin, partial [Cupriavidus sp.]|nr:carbohydrate porin [Cupriavidus sp.]